MPRSLALARGYPADMDGVTTTQRRQITRALGGIAVYALAFGMTFGAVSVASGLTLAQSLVLSVVMFTGASQFAFVGVIGAGGLPVAAISAALLLGARNAFYGVPVSAALRPQGRSRLWTAHFVIDETTAMLGAQQDTPAKRLAFWATGIVLFVAWVAGTAAGAIAGEVIDPDALGLDAAAPAVFLALLWPHLRTLRASALAGASVLVAVALIPIAAPGVPVLAAALLAVAAGLLPGRDRTHPEVPSDVDGLP
ncbi:MAG: hypothetical protein JWM90_2341 [Thermoleophilia bacterium]|nr:hypothetical protein [Thermoleophilia bacterium]